MMCLKSSFVWGSYDAGTLHIISARLTSATSDKWEALQLGRRFDDNTRGLLRIGLLPTEADCGLGFALLLEGGTPAVSIDI